MVLKIMVNFCNIWATLAVGPMYGLAVGPMYGAIFATAPFSDLTILSRPLMLGSDP